MIFERKQNGTNHTLVLTLTVQSILSDCGEANKYDLRPVVLIQFADNAPNHKQTDFQYVNLRLDFDSFK